MTEERKYNKFISKTTNSNKLINITLILGFVILIISQISFFNYMTQQRLRVTATADTVPQGTTSQNLTLTASNIQLTACADDDLANAIALVKPSIVNIDVPINGSSSTPTQRRGGPEATFDIPSTQALASDDETLGSGIIVGNKGYILTCYHLIKDQTDIHVTLFSADKNIYKAQIIEVDPVNDLALLKIEADKLLPAVTIGNSDLIKITDPILTLGSPFGFEYTVTRGIISDNKRDMVINGQLYPGLFQTDAAINRGSAGGALISTGGEVIGITTAIVSESDYFVGISFAIPINKARPLLLKAIWD